MPDEGPEFLRQFIGSVAGPGGEDEPRSVSFGMLGPKPQIGLVLVDARGEPFGTQYAHLLYVQRRGDQLVLRYTYGEVVLAGRGLFAPVERSLLRYLNDHRVPLIRAVAESRDTGHGDGPVVHDIRVVLDEPRGGGTGGSHQGPPQTAEVRESA